MGSGFGVVESIGRDRFGDRHGGWCGIFFGNGAGIVIFGIAIAVAGRICDGDQPLRIGEWGLGNGQRAKGKGQWAMGCTLEQMPSRQIRFASSPTIASRRAAHGGALVAIPPDFRISHRPVARPPRCPAAS